MSPPSSTLGRCATVGAGRLGRTLADALRAASVAVDGPLGRGADGAGADVVLLCVPDAEIAAAARCIAAGPLVGHCSGATGLDVLAPHQAFGLHPMMTVTHRGADFAGAGAAIGGTTERALDTARALAEAVGLVPFAIDDADRAAHHAACSIASNFLLTLEGAAEALAVSAGARRELLVPLVRAAVENWARDGAGAALTGPIARGDEATVARQRAAVTQLAPEFLPAFDGLVDATRVLA
ncbi:MAG: hypothetical protein JWN32_274 [Solirubrobacterales bacterium]|jgi:predicted short-subunit dehydrogenase-like oxidoreductase (DUF2520 family)|nr:hypothetical protein [Solirubrobacterales bacterium]